MIYYYYGGLGGGFLIFTLLLLLLRVLLLAYHINRHVDDTVNVVTSTSRDLETATSLKDEARMAHKMSGLAEPFIQNEKVAQPFLVRWGIELQALGLFAFMLPAMVVLLVGIVVIICADDLHHHRYEVFLFVSEIMAYTTVGCIVLVVVLTALLMSCRVQAINKARNSLFGGDAVFHFKHDWQTYRNFCNDHLRQVWAKDSISSIFVYGYVLPITVNVAVPFIVVAIMELSNQNDWGFKENMLFYGAPSAALALLFCLLWTFAYGQRKINDRARFEKLRSTAAPPVTLIGKNSLYANGQFYHFGRVQGVMIPIEVKKVSTPYSTAVQITAVVVNRRSVKRFVIPVCVPSEEMADSILAMNLIATYPNILRV